MKLLAVIFDLDGVLVDTARFHYLGWRRLADEESVPFDEAFNERFKGVSRADCVKMLFPGEATGHRLEALSSRKNRYFLEMVETLTPKDVFPGVLELTAALKANGIKIAVASASRNAGRILEKLGLADLFDAVVDGNQVENSKPAPDGFLLAAEKLGVSPAGCVVVEDAEAGIQAAHAAGMKALGLGAREILKHAEKVVPAFSHISMALLKSL